MTPAAPWKGAARPAARPAAPCRGGAAGRPLWLLQVASLLALGAPAAAATRSWRRAPDERAEVSSWWGSSDAPEPSMQRRECLAREEMATRIYPVEKHPLDSYILRLAVPALPSVGDLHLIVGDVQITRLVANLQLQRKDDQTFSFGLHGDGGANMAMVEAWVDSFDFNMPQSTMDTWIKGLSETENWFGSLGWKSNYGQLKKLKVTLNISMSGDIRTDEHGSWQVVPGSEKTQAIFNIGSGGLVLRVVNSILAGSGGKVAEEAIFDILWPMLVQLLPASAGVALGVVPKDEGDVGIKIALEAWCQTPAAHSVSNKNEKRLCPGHLMQVKAKVETKAHVRAMPVLEKMGEKSEVGVLAALAEAYRGSAKTRPKMEIPMALLHAMTPQLRRWRTSCPGRAECPSRLAASTCATARSTCPTSIWTTSTCQWAPRRTTPSRSERPWTSSR
ncbi:unnamed protein product [Prorocentrum cordatum]|nr:unnamed protein product [Polarella glacialis]